MSYQTILVQFTDVESAEHILDAALGLAQKHKAFVVGVHVLPQVVIPSPAVAAEAWSSIYEVEHKRLTETGEKLEVLFSNACKKRKLKYEWRQDQATYSVADIIIRHALCADIVVLAQSDPDSETAAHQQEITERVMLESGRPVLVIPYAGRFDVIGSHALVAWTPTREASRAAFDALPMLMDAEEVRVLTVNPSGQNGQTAVSTATQFAVSLARHGVKANATHTSSGEISVGNELLSRASDYGSDLLVMGGYGHSRFREVVFGGATREILMHMTVPVLMSH